MDFNKLSRVSDAIQDVCLETYAQENNVSFKFILKELDKFLPKQHVDDLIRIIKTDYDLEEDYSTLQDLADALTPEIVVHEINLILTTDKIQEIINHLKDLE